MDSEILSRFEIESLISTNQRFFEGNMDEFVKRPESLRSTFKLESFAISEWLPRVGAKDKNKDEGTISPWTVALSWITAKKNEEKKGEEKEERRELTPREVCWLSHSCG